MATTTNTTTTKKTLKIEKDQSDIDMSSFRPDGYPEDLYELEAGARRHALKRTTELMDQGYHKSLALSMGIALAREWADNGKTDPEALPGPSQHVIPDHSGWLICAEDGNKPSACFQSFEHALRRAHELATKHQSAIYVYDIDGHLIDRYESYGSDIGDGFHVMPWKDEWAIKVPGDDGVFEHFNTKRAALKSARERARDAETMMIVHYQDGAVQHTRDYSSH